jgi:hypothetical protein
MKVWFIHAILCAVLLVTASCSNSSNPVLPSSGTEIEPVAVSNADSGLITNPYRGVFGAWMVRIDKDSLTAEIVPARNAQGIGLIVDADLQQFLTVSPCHDCIRITRITLAQDGNLHIDLAMKHPFANGVARPDLHGFDVRAIFIGAAYAWHVSEITLMRPGGIEEAVEISDQFLLNADGYTSHYDEIVSDPRYFIGGNGIIGNLNGFLRFFEDYSTATFDSHAPAGHNVMPTGSNIYSRTAVIDKTWYESPFGGYFYIVADVAYGQSAVFANRDNPQYYLPAFNRTEPWRVEYYLENNNLSDTDPTSTTDVVVQVFDWQQGATVDSSYPNPSNLSGIPVSSDVAEVKLFVSSMSDTPIIETAPEGGTGSPTDPLEYRLTIANEKIYGGFSRHTGILAIRDQLYGQTGRVPIPVTPAGFPYETLDILDYALYQLITINVPNMSSPIPYNSEFYLDNQSTVATAANTTSVEGTFFMDKSHLKYQYQWDWDYDGVTFDPEGTGMPSAEYTFPHSGTFDTRLRVTTNSVPPMEYYYDVPVYCVGEEFTESIDESAQNHMATSYNRGQSIWKTDDRYYVAYTSDSGGKYDIWLAVGDKTGSFTTKNLTGSLAFACDSPSICVVEEGAHAGVYVGFNVYNAGYDVYSTKGNLDGSGFTAADIQPIANTADLEVFPSIVAKDGYLLAYYMKANPGGQVIFISSSVDFGESWTPQLAVSTTLDLALNPSAIVLEDQSVYVAFVDQSVASQGSDVYLARSYTGTNFDKIWNLSAVGDVDEYFPNIAANDDQVVVAFMRYEGSGLFQTNLSILNLHSLALENYKIKSLLGWDHYSPAVGTGTTDRFIVAFSSYNSGTTEINSSILEISRVPETQDFAESIILQQSMGTMEIAGATGYPKVFSRSVAGGYGAENFIVWKDYSSGYLKQTVPSTVYFADISAMSYVTQGNPLFDD